MQYTSTDRQSNGSPDGISDDLTDGQPEQEPDTDADGEPFASNVQ